MLQFLLIFLLLGLIQSGKAQEVEDGMVKSKWFSSFRNTVQEPAQQVDAGVSVGENPYAEFSPRNIFRRGYHKASYLLSNITAQFNKAGPSKSVEIINPKTGVKTSYDISDQKTDFEGEDLTLHMCNEPGEAYSASWLTTREHVIATPSEAYNLTWVNCEMASFIHMRRSMKHHTDRYNDGMIMQSLDVLDFSVIHLSAYERVNKRYMKILWKARSDYHLFKIVDEVKATGQLLENEWNPKISKKEIIWSEDAKRTVVIMPFLGGAMGSGHSELGNRFVYLRACFWSLYQFFPNIVAGVSRQSDVDWAWKESGLPFYDMILLDNLPKSAGLPVGLTQKVKQRLNTGGQWEKTFDFVFFTESDQILIWRTMHHMYDHLRKYPRRMLLPHRLMPYMGRALVAAHQRTLNNDTHSWQYQSCCLPRQNCDHRRDWVNLNSPKVPIVNYLGLQVPLGNVDFLLERYRYCTMQPKGLDEYTFCP